MLTVSRLSCERNERMLFNELSLTVQTGEVLQVLGRNGTGKSSLLKLLAGLIQPLAGSICWHGQTIGEDRANYAAAIFYLGHLDGLKAGLSVAENVAFTCSILAGNSDQQDQAIQRLGLAAYRNTLVEHLSAGQRRRTALAQLLLTRATLWILDEPFTALDKQTINFLEQLLLEHGKLGGMAVVATHQNLNLPGVKLQTCELS